MISTIRIPTWDQYAFIEVQFEGSQEEIIAKYHELLAEAKKPLPPKPRVNPEVIMIPTKDGMKEAEFNRVIDRYLWGDCGMLADEYDEMNREQKSFVQMIKRSRKRNNKPM